MTVPQVSLRSPFFFYQVIIEEFITTIGTVTLQDQALQLRSLPPTNHLMNPKSTSHWKRYSTIVSFTATPSSNMYTERYDTVLSVKSDIIDRNIYLELVNDLCIQLDNHKAAAAARGGELAHLQDQSSFTSQSFPQDESPLTMVSLDKQTAAFVVTTTFELLQLIIYALPPEDILLIARYVCRFWSQVVADLLRKPVFVKNLRRHLCIESASKAVQRGTLMSQGFKNPQCTSQALPHLDCTTCAGIRTRESKLEYSVGDGHGKRGKFDLRAYYQSGLREVIQESGWYRAKFWLDMSQFRVNPLLAQMLGTTVHERHGRWDFDLEEQRGGSFTFMQSNTTKRSSIDMDKAFISDPPCKSISILMPDRAIGRVESATLENPNGVSIGELLATLEKLAHIVAGHSANAIEEFLNIQKTEQPNKCMELIIAETSTRKGQAAYSDWNWRHKVVPPSKMEVSIVLTGSRTAGNLPVRPCPTLCYYG